MSRQARRMVYDRSDWWGFVGGIIGAWMNPDFAEMPQLYEALEGWKSICGQAYSLKGVWGKIFFLLTFLPF